MRLIKMLGLAAMAALVATAFIGASTASAEPGQFLTVLCETAELDCKENAFPDPTTIVAHAEKTKLLSSVVTVLCEKSLAEVTLLNTLALKIEGHILDFKFEECHTASETACTVTVLETGSLLFHKIGELEASVTAMKLGENDTKANVKCGFLINCTYTGTENTLVKAHSLENGETHLLANETKLEEGKGFACPSESFWDANYLALGEMWIES